MKIFHISDLHIGCNLIEHEIGTLQKETLHFIVNAVKEQRPDVLLIAGDIYDRAAPSGEAFSIFDGFLQELSAIEPKLPVLIISGNHDNGLRLQYAESFLANAGIIISAALPSDPSQHLKKVTIRDEYGPVNFYLLPFVKPADARNYLKEAEKADAQATATPETSTPIDATPGTASPSVDDSASAGTAGQADTTTIRTYEDAVRLFLEREELNATERNVLMAHQFVVGSGKKPILRDSETRLISVGGIDQVDASCMIDFDYTALGHIHSAQDVVENKIRYCGTPLKYSISEASDTKAITVVNLEAKGTTPQITMIPIPMKPDVRKLSGTLQELLDLAKDSDLADDYVSLTITDEKPVYRPKDRLSSVYHRILETHVSNKQTNAILTESKEETGELEPMDAFTRLYEEVNGQPLSDDERKLMSNVIERAMTGGQG